MAGEAAVGSNSLGSFRVMIVEDEPLQLEAIVGLFNAANDQNAGAVTFQVSTASSCEECTDQLASSPADALPDLVLLDHGMQTGILQGADLLPRLREMLPVGSAVVMASARSEVRRQGRNGEI